MLQYSMSIAHPRVNSNTTLYEYTLKNKNSLSIMQISSQLRYKSNENSVIITFELFSSYA